MDKQRFELKSEHVKLAQRTNIDWSANAYIGAPQIDQKRPYGNDSVIEDIAEIIGLELFKDAEGKKHLSKAQENLCLKLHREMETALQVILASGSFEPGIYECPKYSYDQWKKVK